MEEQIETLSVKTGSDKDWPRFRIEEKATVKYVTKRDVTPILGWRGQDPYPELDDEATVLKLTYERHLDLVGTFNGPPKYPGETVECDGKQFYVTTSSLEIMGSRQTVEIKARGYPPIELKPADNAAPSEAGR